MGVRVSGDTDVFARLRWRNRDRFRTAGTKIVRYVIQRTRAGKDADGRPFTPYSAAYAKRKGVAPTDVDLTSRGRGPHMLDNLAVVEVSDANVVVGFPNPAMDERADYVATGRTPRPFMALDDRFLDEIVSYIADGITD
jgi:hypothetical protein